MLILGLLLVIAALVVFGYMFFGTSDLAPLRVDLGVFAVELTPLHLYLLGAATLVLLGLGLLALAAGLRASRRRRQEVKELRKAVKESGSKYGREDTRRGDGGDRRDDVPSAPTSDGRDPRDGDLRDAGAGYGTPLADRAAAYEREVPTGTAPTAPSAADTSSAADPDIRIPSDYDGDGVSDDEGRRGSF